MLCIIGGACSGRRALVAERYPRAVWHRLEPGEPPAGWAGRATSGGVLVVTGWAEWLKALLACLLYTSPSPRDRQKSRMPSSA